MNSPSAKGDASFRPSKVIGIARNYRAHAEEFDNEVPEDEPLFFYKPPTSVTQNGEPIYLPPNLGRIDYEGELGVIISRTAKSISESDALSFVKAYVPAFDITARALQKAKGHFSLAKGFDGFCPLGKIRDAHLDISDLGIRTYLNDECVQDGRTIQMVHSVPRLIAYLSSVITLEENDLILTGTPAGVGPIKPGDTLRLEIDGLEPMTCRVLERG